MRPRRCSSGSSPPDCSDERPDVAFTATTEGQGGTGSHRVVDAVPGVLGTAQQHALDWLRRLIVAGELRPGQRVNQEDLAGRIGLSVAPVREALRVLEQ